MPVPEPVPVISRLLTDVSINIFFQYKALIDSKDHRTALIKLINQKELLGDLFNQLRLALQRRVKERPAQVNFSKFFLWILFTQTSVL